MFKSIKDNYFTSANYAGLYAHSFFRNTASSAMYIFTGAYFLKLGMPLPWVLLFYGLEFGVRGMLCPFGMAVFKKLGIIKSQSLSALLLLLFFVGLSFADQNLMIGFSSLLFAAMSGAIYYPFQDVIEAIYVKDDHNRAKQISLNIVMGSLGRIVGAAGVGYLITHHGFDWVLLMVSVALAGSILPFLRMTPHADISFHFTPKETYQFLLDDRFREFWQPFFGQQLIIIIRAVMVPIFIYSVVGELDTLGYLIALTLMIEKICTLIAGHKTDKIGARKTIRFSLGAYTLAMLSYGFLAKTPLSIFFVESFHKTALNIFDSAFRSAIHNKARKTDGQNILLFGTGWQMGLCIGELVTLPIYALLSVFIGINVFYVACACAVVGMWMVHLYCEGSLHAPIKS